MVRGFQRHLPSRLERTTTRHRTRLFDDFTFERDDTIARLTAERDFLRIVDIVHDQRIPENVVEGILVRRIVDIDQVEQAVRIRRQLRHVEPAVGLLSVSLHFVHADEAAGALSMLFEEVLRGFTAFDIVDHVVIEVTTGGC